MESLLSKLLPLFVYPLGLAITLGLLGLLFGWAGRRAGAAVSAIAAVTLLWVSSTAVFSDFLLASLEADYPPVAVAALPEADAIVVLGGAERGVVPGTSMPDLGDAADRLLHALRIHKAGKAPVLILTGGSAPGFTPESKMLQTLLVELGVPDRDMLLETESRNTRQNAVNSLEIMKAYGMKRVLLVTSAVHMRRARAVFERLGVDVIPAATDYQVVERQRTVLDWLPNAVALAVTTRAVKEYLGWWVYKWRGWV